MKVYVMIGVQADYVRELDGDDFVAPPEVFATAAAAKARAQEANNDDLAEAGDDGGPLCPTRDWMPIEGTNDVWSMSEESGWMYRVSEVEVQS